MDLARLTNTDPTIPFAKAAAARNPDKTQADAMQAAKEFESLFLAQFAQILFSGLKSDGPFGGGPAEDIYKNLLAEEYGKAMAQAGGIGIADSVYREMLKSQEVA